MNKSNSLLIENLQLFLTSEKKAKKIEFTDGINIITSDQKNGNKVGKSLLLKSIYHTLGAESHLDKTLPSNEMVFLVQFRINDTSYSILRSGSLFKLFDSELSLLLSTSSASELAEMLYELYDFSVYLPSRIEDKLQIAPPAYAYILNFIDQDHMNGSTFDSFAKLTQFSNYKENLLYCHFGLFDDKFFNLTRDKDRLLDDLNTKNKELTVISNMLSKIEKDIPKSVPENIEALKIELDRKETEYKNTYSELKKIKNRLTKLRHEQSEALTAIDNISIHEKKEIKELTVIMKEHSCPLCKQDIEDSLNIRMDKNINLGDLAQASLYLQKVIEENKKKIQKEEKCYYELSKKITNYKKILRGSKKETDDFIKLQGYSDLQTKLNKEWSVENKKVIDLESKITEIKAQLNLYNEKKKKVNNSYYKSMKQDILKFELQEIPDKSIKNIKNVVTATGSNNPVITIIWYFNLLKLKKEFNPNKIKFPIILDSPNHGELDDEKKDKLFKYLFKNVIDGEQCIISTLGFNEEDFESSDDFNIIKLDNPRYQLLTELDYKQNIEFLNILIER